MAFYAYDSTRQAVQTIGPNEGIRRDGVGAYYAYDATHEAVQPINGASLGASASLTDEVMRDILGNRRPVLVAGEWAERVTDTVWRPQASSSELTLIPITDADLARVRKNAGGHEVPLVGILAQRSARMRDSENAFVGTPYTLQSEIAVYAALDRRPVPVPAFLTIARLREDPADRDGGKDGVQAAAMALRGQLVYVVSLPARTRRALPPIEQALMSLPPLPGGKPSAPGAPPPPVTPDRIELSGAPARGGFRHPGVLGEVSTPVVALGVGVALLCGLVVATAAMGGAK